MIVQFTSVQGDIYALGKVHICTPPCLSFPICQLMVFYLFICLGAWSLNHLLFSYSIVIWLRARLLGHSVTLLLSVWELGSWAIQLHYYYLSGGLVVGPFSYTTKRASWAGPSHGSSWAGNVLLHSVEPNTVIVIKYNIKKYCPVFVISQMCWGEILFT